ncbi:ABC-type antimicrobial peptide transport system permease subunit [Chitinivorax tropicus]|uniref:ABC-type antimicrobial peptide transport system permease subunit n=1 Tax=Chitinivorax tropicus TaxID=714531 RepID=A0A840MNI9_9PROT|nr:ABC transporter permease [Chitinivorax tropicus]MBB5020208.1 ABC-type antimicrobial peptide transport system permease subunit [Chitinivorax tropicus]
MKIPFRYIVRNLAVRKLTTLFTAAGMGMVVFVFAAVLMMSNGLKQTLVQTGSKDNVVLIRASSQTEVQSGVSRDQASIVEANPLIAVGRDGHPQVSKEAVVLITLPKRSSGIAANVVTRGIQPVGLALRPQVQLIEGRLFRPDSNEVMVGKAIADKFTGAGLGESLRFGGREWRIVGIFDAGKTAFSSEIWGDRDQMMQAFRRTMFSAVIAKLADSDHFDQFKAAVENNRQLTLEAKRETRFYADQSEQIALFINVLGIAISIIFSVGAMIGAAITMYSSVANRIGEIGTLRALGFQRSSVLAAFMLESMALALLGGVMGLALASTLQFLSLSTTNFQTFSELAFTFELSPAITIQSLLFALIMGLIGGFLPAIRAARMKIVDALREA